MAQAKPQLKSGAGEVQKETANMDKKKPPKPEVLDPQDTSKSQFSAGDVAKTQQVDADRQRQAGQSQFQQQSTPEAERQQAQDIKNAQRVQKAGQSAQTAGRGVQTAGRGMQAAGTGAKAAGAATQAAGKGAQLAGKGTQLAGKGAQAAGKGLSKAGDALMKGAGAAASVPVVGTLAGAAAGAAGVAAKGAGAGAQAAGKGTEMAGKGVEAAGKGVEKAGKGVSKAGDKIKDTGKNIKDKGKDIKEKGKNIEKFGKDAEQEAKEGEYGPGKQRPSAGIKPPSGVQTQLGQAGIGGTPLANKQDEKLAQQLAAAHRSEDANKYLNTWRNIRQTQGLAKFNQMQGRVQHLMNNPRDIDPAFRKELTGKKQIEAARKSALQADKQQSKQKAKAQAAAKAKAKPSRAAKRRAKAGAKYKPGTSFIIYLLAAVYAFTIEIIILIISLLSASIASYLDWIIDYFILWPTLGFFLWTQGQGKGRVKKALTKVTAAAGLETIPYLDYLPMWTLSVVWAWAEAWYNSKKNQ